MGARSTPGVGHAAANAVVTGALPAATAEQSQLGSLLVRGPLFGEQTRCVHYHGERDVIAIRFRCCDRHSPCIRCHETLADHPVGRWAASERDAPAVLCGVCTQELTIAEYLPASACPRCGAGFNPGCRLHHHLYFA